MKSEKGREEDGRKVKHVDSPECSRNLGVGAAAMRGKGVKTQLQLKRGNYYSKPLALSTRCFFRARSTISSVVGGGRWGWLLSAWEPTGRIRNGAICWGLIL